MFRSYAEILSGLFFVDGHFANFFGAPIALAELRAAF
jgi:hypothetical protein